MNQKHNRIATFVRLPLYRNYLLSLNPMPEYISAASIASALNFGEVQVRKDLACICDGGRPRIGYVTAQLLASLDDVLNRRGSGEAVLVGAGKLGSALLDYSGFAGYGIEIVAGFDCAVARIGETAGGKPVYSVEELEDFCQQHRIRIGIITVPAFCAQKICDRLVSLGIRAIWCFAPIRLNAPDDIIIRYENLAASLGSLTAQLDGLGGDAE